MSESACLLHALRLHIVCVNNVKVEKLPEGRHNINISLSFAKTSYLLTLRTDGSEQEVNYLPDWFYKPFHIMLHSLN